MKKSGLISSSFKNLFLVSCGNGHDKCGVAISTFIMNYCDLSIVDAYKIFKKNRYPGVYSSKSAEFLRGYILKNQNGKIKEGTVLPSIRQLAKELGISVITTTRAYRELEAEGYIASVQGKGSIVLKRDNQLLTEQVQRQIEEHLDAAITASRQLQMTDEELVQTLKLLQENR